MKLIAHRQLTGIYGTVVTGQEFECPDDVARELLISGVVHKAEPPKVQYETKVIRPAEVGPAQPFRDVPVRDEKPAPVAAPGNRVVQVADLSGTAFAPGRRRR
jgi:hypothetical protein